MYIYIYIHICIFIYLSQYHAELVEESCGVATIGRLLKNIVLFCKRALFSFAKEPYLACGAATISWLLKLIVAHCKRAPQKRLFSAKKTYYFKEPTNRSHPMIGLFVCVNIYIVCLYMCMCVQELIEESQLYLLLVLCLFLRVCVHI